MQLQADLKIIVADKKETFNEFFNYLYISAKQKL